MNHWKIFFLDTAEQNLFIYFFWKTRKFWEFFFLKVCVPDLNFKFSNIQAFIEKKRHFKRKQAWENGSNSSEKTAERSFYFICNIFFVKICHSVSLRWFHCFRNIRFWSLRILFFRNFPIFEHSNFLCRYCIYNWSNSYCTYCIKWWYHCEYDLLI